MCPFAGRRADAICELVVADLGGYHVAFAAAAGLAAASLAVATAARKPSVTSKGSPEE